nr:NADH-cytochrome b5 reductase 2-like [Dermacentor andersoni]
MEIQGPRGRFVYEGQGRFLTVDGSWLPPATWLGLVAAGSGVTPMIQLLRHVLADVTDKTKIMMIDVNRTEEDIIARRELDNYAKVRAERFSLCHVLSKPAPSEGAITYVAGPLTPAIMAEHLPSPTAETIVLLCGPQKFLSDLCKPALNAIGHKTQRVLCF